MKGFRNPWNGVLIDLVLSPTCLVSVVCRALTSQHINVTENKARGLSASR
jgi:hypothetical protein